MTDALQTAYRLARPFLFRLNPETAHNLASRALARAGRSATVCACLRKALVVDDERLTVSIRSLTCPNPVGLAAGFDKDVELADVLPALGFGFAEVGTLTPLPQAGQRKPRLFRYPGSRALVNRMGFNNPGVKTAMERLKHRRGGAWRIPIGINIGKGRNTPVEEAAADYAAALEHVLPFADYLVLNVSSPNTPGLRSLQSVESLRPILTPVVQSVRAYAEKAGEPPKLVFTKIAPDCTDEQLEDIARLSIELGTGIVATNTTIDHAALGAARREEGGLSGYPLREKSDKVIRFLRRATKGVVPLIGVGGVFTAADAYAKIRAGASLVQVYTGWIYGGPTLARDINRGLLKLLERDGFARVQDAVGTETGTN